MGRRRPIEKRPGGDPTVGIDRSRRLIVRFEKRARECTYVASLTRLSGETQGNQQGRSIARAAVFKRGESYGYDPNPSDLRVGKVKHGESYVEAC